MNKTYSKVWSKALGQLVVVSELASAKKAPGSRQARVGAVEKRSAGAVAWGALVVLGALGYAEPSRAQLYINDGVDGACAVIVDQSVNSDLVGQQNAKCNTDPSTQTDHSQFFGPSTGVGSTGNATNSLSLGGSLFVNAGQIGVSDVAGGTYSMRLGSMATLGAAAGIDAIAIGSAQTTDTNGSTTAATAASGARAIAIGSMANASGDDAIVLGTGAATNGAGSIVIGRDASAQGGAPDTNAIAIGVGASSFGQSFALGTGASADQLGFDAADSSVAIGANASTATNTTRGVAIGVGAGVAAADAGTALGAGAQATADNALALGTSAMAGDANAVALGSGSSTAAAVATTGATINGTAYTFAGTAPSSTVSVGAAGAERTVTNVAAGRISGASTDAVNGSQLYATNQALDGLGTTVNNIQNGAGIKYFHADSTEPDSQARGTDSVAIGPNAVAGNAGDVALGSGATTAAAVATPGATIGGVAYTFAGANPLSVVSVGAPGAERQIQNVAAGRLGADSTDAVNGSQLYATNQQVTQNATSITNLDNRVTDIEGDITNIGNGSSGMFQVSQDRNAPPPSPTGANSAAGGAGASASGAGSLAVGNDSAAAGDNATALGTGAAASGTASTAVGQGAGASGANATAVGQGASATGGGGTAMGQGASAAGAGSTAMGQGASAAGDGSVAIGQGATASNAGDVALGSGSTTAAAVGVGSATVNGVTYGGFAGSNPTSVVSVGAAGNERQIQNVAAGQVTATSTDAVNGSQLYSVASQVSQIGSSVGDITTQVTQNTTDITNLQNGKDGFFQVNDTSGKAKPSATGQDAAAGGAGAVASGSNSLAVGTDANASASNSVAIGSGSVADRDDSVSVGAAGSERQITNVAAGTADTDAVNVSQLKVSQAGNVQYNHNADGSNDYTNVTLNPGGSPTTIHNVGAGTAATDAANVGQLNDGLDQVKDWSKSYTDSRFDSVDRDLDRIGNRANAGVASAMAMASLPQAYQPNQNSAGVALGSFHGETGIAVGLSAISESGRYILKLNASTNTRGDAGVGVGAGIVW